MGAEDTDILAANCRRLERELSAAREQRRLAVLLAAVTGLAARQDIDGPQALAEKAGAIADAVAAQEARRRGLTNYCPRCGEPHGQHWLDGGETCPRCLLVN